jgi:diguanylate cyclase (GGDEF)-like protein
MPDNLVIDDVPLPLTQAADSSPATVQAKLPAPTRRRRGGWLCRNEADRLRLVEMSPSVRSARRMAGALCGIGVLAMAPWLGWGPLVVFLFVPAPLLLVDAWMRRSLHPERIAAAVIVFNFVLIVLGAAVSGGEHSPILPWVAIPVVTAAARFRWPVFLAGSGLAAVAVLVCLFVLSAGAVKHDPSSAIAMVVLLAGLVVVQRPVLDAESRWRKDAVLDPLTGLLNRQGLERRFSELAEQARLVDASVALVLFDLDHFKSVNDDHGHARGDEVLVEVAYTLRKELRSFELLYRLGGDELLLLLPGADDGDARQVAEHAREAIQECRPGDLEVTASIGVASGRGADLDFNTMLAAADRSLYDAKRAGRNAVVVCA